MDGWSGVCVRYDRDNEFLMRFLVVVAVFARNKIVDKLC